MESRLLAELNQLGYKWEKWGWLDFCLVLQDLASAMSVSIRASVEGCLHRCSVVELASVPVVGAERVPYVRWQLWQLHLALCGTLPFDLG